MLDFVFKKRDVCKINPVLQKLICHTITLCVAYSHDDDFNICQNFKGVDSFIQGNVKNDNLTVMFDSLS